MSEIIALIPARGGSKGVPKKNIKLLGGHPLIAYSIAACRMSERISRVIVSTDSEEIAEVSRAYGAEVPFLRPSEFAQDRSSDLVVFTHFLEWWKGEGHAEPAAVAHMRPTTPLRDPAVIDRAIADFAKHPEATALRSAHELSEPVEKFFRIGENGQFEGIFPNDPRPEYYNLPRQTFRPCYHPNGYLDLVLPRTLHATGKLHGSSIAACITPRSTEIDTAEEFDLLEYEIAKRPSILLPFLEKSRRL